MRPVDEFLRSVRTAFRPDDDATGTGWLWLLAVVVLLALLLVLGRIRGRRQANRLNADALSNLIAARNLGGADERLIVRMAERVGLAPVLVATQVDAFERATAAELAAASPTVANAPASTLAPSSTMPSGAEGLAAHLGRLRRTLGFHVLPDHLALLTTRQLSSGQRVQIAAVEGMVTEVDEAVFVVEAVAGGAFTAGTAGQTVQVAFARGSEARYLAHCPVIEAQPVRAPQRLTLSHDEKPERLQLRNAVRVAAQGTIELRPRTALAVPAGADGPVTRGELVDLSVGGLALSTEVRLPVSAALHASFDWEGGEYRDLPVWVIECVPRLRGRFLARLEFRGLPAIEEARLAAAVARRSAHSHEGTPSP